MNWEAIGAIAEAISAVAVLFTLIYLALQIRNNTAATVAQIHQDASGQTQDWALSIANSEELAEIMDKVSDHKGTFLASKLKELSRVERRRLYFLHLAANARWRNLYEQSERGFFDWRKEKAKHDLERVYPIYNALGIPTDHPMFDEVRETHGT